MALENFGLAMKDASIRFYAIEHLLMMLAVAVLIYIGRVKSKRAKTDTGKFRIASVFLLIALMLIYAAIPWGRL